MLAPWKMTSPAPSPDSRARVASISSDLPSPLRTTLCPASAKLSAIPSPMPLVEPLMITVFMDPSFQIVAMHK
jgi:hypothetical protein